MSRAKGAADGTFDLSWSATGPSTGFTVLNVVTAVGGIGWAGFAATSTDAALASDLSAKFDDFKALAYHGLRTFIWYVFRDMGLPGIPDLIGAHLLAGRIKPAHTFAAAVKSKSVLCDDPIDGLCDHAPMGAL